MKQKKLSADISKRFKKLETLYDKIIARFEMESIHEFRTEIKKLRALLRFLNVEIDDNRLKIPREIKLFYSYAGAIRNLQLQLENMDPYAADPQYRALEFYFDYLKKIIEKWKESATESIILKRNFNNHERRILKHVPGKIRKSAAKKFLKNKMNELACLVKNLPDDDALHSVRKLFKDISYNWAFVKQYANRLPSAFSEEEKIKSLTESIGLFLDKGIGIILLETYCKDCEENGVFFEKDLSELQKIEEGWRNEKRGLTQMIYSSPGLQNLLPAG